MTTTMTVTMTVTVTETVIMTREGEERERKYYSFTTPRSLTTTTGISCNAGMVVDGIGGYSRRMDLLRTNQRKRGCRLDISVDHIIIIGYFLLKLEMKPAFLLIELCICYTLLLQSKFYYGLMSVCMSQIHASSIFSCGCHGH